MSDLFSSACSQIFSVLPTSLPFIFIFYLTKLWGCFQVTCALLNMRQQNAYPVNPLPPWHKPQHNPINPTDNIPLDNQLPSNVVETVNNSRLEAQKLVNIAMQVTKSSTSSHYIFI